MFGLRLQTLFYRYAPDIGELLWERCGFARPRLDQSTKMIIKVENCGDILPFVWLLVLATNV